MASRLRRRLPWVRILFAPFLVRRRDVERAANISYGDAGASNLLDVYRHRSHPSGGPTLVYLHGGAFRSGRKNREARPLIYRLASQGWVCISANYRMSPKATFPDQLIDVKKVIAWVREHGPEYGADPAVVFVAGSSAGGHMAAFAALTPNDPAFQPGFGYADTSVTAAISLYGYYGPVDANERTPSSPLAHVGTPGAAVLRGARRSGHDHARGRRSTLRGDSAERLAQSGRPRGAAPGRSTSSTVSTPSASTRSSTPSRPSPPGCGHGDLAPNS
jgi:acetyl esterase/lipase